MSLIFLLSNQPLSLTKWGSLDANEMCDPWMLKLLEFLR